MAEAPKHPASGSDAGDGLYPVLLGRERAADFLGIGKRLAWELANRRILRTVRIGRRVLYPVDDLREWVSRGCPERPEWWRS